MGRDQAPAPRPGGDAQGGGPGGGNGGEIPAGRVRMKQRGQMPEDPTQQAVRTLRYRQRMTQKELAALMGVKELTANLWENRRLPSARGLYHLMIYAEKCGYGDLASVFRKALGLPACLETTSALGP